jgi:hypothetical protein
MLYIGITHLCNGKTHMWTLRPEIHSEPQAVRRHIYVIAFPKGVYIPYVDTVGIYVYNTKNILNIVFANANYPRGLHVGQWQRKEGGTWTVRKYMNTSEIILIG